MKKIIQFTYATGQRYPATLASEITESLRGRWCAIPREGRERGWAGAVIGWAVIARKPCLGLPLSGNPTLHCTALLAVAVCLTVAFWQEEPGSIHGQRPLDSRAEKQDRKASEDVQVSRTPLWSKSGRSQTSDKYEQPITFSFSNSCFTT